MAFVNIPKNVVANYIKTMGCPVAKLPDCHKDLFFAENHLTFWGGHITMLSTQKKAVTKTVRQTGFTESQRLVRADRMVPYDPSLPSRSAEALCQVLTSARVKG